MALKIATASALESGSTSVREISKKARFGRAQKAGNLRGRPGADDFLVQPGPFLQHLPSTIRIAYRLQQTACFVVFSRVFSISNECIFDTSNHMENEKK